MPRNQLFINDIDAYERWGLSMDSQCLSALMMPAAMKATPKNTSRLEDGTRYVHRAPRKVAERSLTLTPHIVARNPAQFMARYNDFVTFIQQEAPFVLRTSFQPEVYYRLVYESSNQFTQFMRGMAFFSLKLTEPNPRNRSLEDIYDTNDNNP